MKPLRIPGLDTYFGGKGGAGVYQQIINRIPPCDTLVVPFLGNCAVTRHIRRPSHLRLNDADPRIVALWRAAQVPDAILSERDWDHFLTSTLIPESVRVMGRVVVYCDPPYLFDSRKGQRDVYHHEMGDEARHRALLTRLRSFDGTVPVLISHYPHPLYDELLHDWQRITFTAQTRRGPATEALYFNFPPPTVLHDDQYAGANYREREYVKRKTNRWVKKWNDLAPHEQQHILARILKDTPPDLLAELAAASVNHDSADPTAIFTVNRS